MTFGMYRPTMGVAGGHRETSSNQSLHENRRQAEHMRRQDNPITGEAMHGGSRPNSGDSAPSRGRPPRGHFDAGLVPTKGPLDHMTGGKDVPQKRVDPSRNQSVGLAGAGLSCIPHVEANLPVRSNSRLTEGAFGEGFSIRESTPERRHTPGQVLRGNSRPKDNLTAGCLTSDKQEHPLQLPRKAGSGGYGVGSGGAGSLVQGPMGFVPAGMEDLYGEQHLRDPSPAPGSGTAVPFRRACGAAVAR